MTVKNTGIGDGHGLKAVISATGTVEGLKYSTKPLPTIKVGETATVEFPISANMNTVDGIVDFTIMISEPMGFGTDKQHINVDTRAFMAPMIEVVDYTITGDDGGELKKMSSFDLQLLVQNTQHGLGKDVKISIRLPQNIFMLSGESPISFQEFKAGEKRSLVYKLIVNNNYISQEIPIKITISETYEKNTKLMGIRKLKLADIIRWNDGNADIERTITLTEDITRIASFEVA